MTRHPQLLHTALVLATMVGCGGGKSAPAPAGADRLEALPDTVQVRPRQSIALQFRLTTETGQPISGHLVSFSIVDDPTTTTDEANGATLAADRALTDADGLAQTTLNAGLDGTFRVRAHTDQAADAEALVFVGSGEYGTAEIVPVPRRGVGPVVTAVETLFYDARSCQALSPLRSPAPLRAPKTVAPDGVAAYQAISTMGSHAVVGRGRDATGTLRAVGCADLPGWSLVPGGVVRVTLPLFELAPTPVGTFTVTSRFTLDPQPPGAAELATVWNDLSDCPLDPAQLWLDCTIDALGGSEPADPLDCRPAAEGPLGDRLVARRGTLAAGACRASTNAAGATGLDALAAALFPTPRPDLVVALPAIAADTGRLLHTLTLGSLLSLAETSTADRYQATHDLRSATLAIADAAYSLDLAALALPALVAHNVATDINDGELEIGRHGLTLHLGAVARVAFGELALHARGAPPTSSGFLDALVGLAKRQGPTGPLTGCAALDALLCSDVGEPVGCLGGACAAGLGALAQRLDAGFRALDGEGLDLLLDGSAVVVDTDADGIADRLGDDSSAPARPGLWSAELRARGGGRAYTGVWTAVRRQ